MTNSYLQTLNNLIRYPLWPLPENEKWEEELQRDLQEFELVSGDVSALDEEALDKDIMELKQAKDIN